MSVLVSELNFRLVQEQDMELLLEWRNDPSTYIHFSKPQSVAKDEHQRWFESMMDNSQRLIYIFENATERVGMVRLDKHGEKPAELSWTVGPSFRGRGFAKQMVRTIVDKWQDELCFFAKVKSENIASARVAEFAGLTHSRSEEGWEFWQS